MTEVCGLVHEQKLNTAVITV